MKISTFSVADQEVSEAADPDFQTVAFPQTASYKWGKIKALEIVTIADCTVPAF